MIYIRSLNDLKPDETATVKRLCCHDDICKRLYDLGIFENTKITCVGKSPLGDPSAYLIRGAVIVLRTEDSRYILI